MNADGRRYLDAMGIRQWVRRDWQALLREPESVVEAAAPTALVTEAAAPSAAARAKKTDARPQPAEVPAVIPMSAAADWQALQAGVASCRQCELHATRTRAVFGVGDPHADWMLIGEAPGADEDRLGEPFVGRSGHLLDQMLQAVGYSREQVFIANTLKCRPPNNRDPLVAESACCRPWLQQQIAFIQPKVIMAVGGVAARNLLNTTETPSALRGKVHHYDSIPLVVSYHPDYLLRSPSQKRKAWQDLLLVRQVLQGAS